MRLSLMLSLWNPARLEICSPAYLTSVDFITGGVMNAPVLCCSCVSMKTGLQTGATDCGSVHRNSWGCSSGLSGDDIT